MNNLIRKLVQAAKAKIAELDDKAALEYKEIYPQWESRIGKQVAMGDRLYYNDRLWKVVQGHTVQDDWRPDVAASLYVQVVADDSGSIDNPIAYEVNMELVEGKYYTEEDVKYLCTRGLAQSVWHLRELVGQYVSIV